MLEAELSNIKAESGHQFNPNHLQPKRLNMTPTTATSSAPLQRSPEAAINISFEASATTLNQSPRTIQSPLDQRVAELSENLKLLESKCKLKAPKVIFRGNKKPLKIYLVFMRDAEKCVLFAIRLVTTERIVRKFLVTMSTLAS